MADPWRSRFTAVPRLENEGFQNFHSIHWPLQLQLDYVLDYGFLRFRLQLHVATLQLDIFVYNCMWQYYSGTTFRTTASSFSVYKCMWPRGSSSKWNVQVLEETFQRVALENRLKGATNRLEKSSDEKHHWHSAEPVW